MATEAPFTWTSAVAFNVPVTVTLLSNVPPDDLDTVSATVNDLKAKMTISEPTAADAASTILVPLVHV